MQSARRGIRGVVIAALLASLMVAALPVASAEEATVLGHFCVRDAKGLTDKIVKLVNKFAPGMGDAMVAPQAQQFFQKAGMAGVDWSKPVSVALLSGKAFGKTEPVPVAIFPVANADALQAMTDQPDAPKMLDVRGDYAVAADEEAALKAITPQRLAIYSQWPQIAGTTDVYATFYVSRALNEYMPEIEQQIQQTQQQFEQGGAPGMPGGGPMAMAQQMMKAWGPMAKLASKQARRVSLMAQFNDDSVDMAGRLYAMPDSELSKFFDGQPQETTDLVKYLPADSVMSMNANLEMEAFRPLVKVVVDALAEPLSITDENRQKINDLIFASTQTGAAAVGLSGSSQHKGIQTVQIAQIKDAEKFRQATKDGMDWLMGSGLLGGLQGAGMDITIDHKPAAREYKGVPVDRITVTYKQKAGAQPNPMMPNRPPQTTELAAFDTFGITVSNNPDGDLMNNIIDRIKAGGGEGLDQAQAYKAAVAAADERAGIVAHVSFNSFLAKMVEEIAKIQPMIAMMAGGVAKPNPTEAPITGYARFATYRNGSAVNFRVRVPHQPILDLVQRVQMMMQQMKQRGPGAGPQPPGGGQQF
jgi:hypothetical protein